MIVFGKKTVRKYLLVLCCAVAQAAPAVDIIPARVMSLDLARDIAQGALDACRKDGYQIAVVVSDRSGHPLIVMRDVFASDYMRQIAQSKANAVVLSHTSSGEMRRNQADILNELNHLPGLLVMRGGLPIQVAGSMLGAVGVSGAPGGDLDEACAQKGIDVVQERLDFAD